MAINANPKAGNKEWAGLAILALPMLLLSMDNSLLYLVLPHMSAALHANSVQQLWMMDIYGFMIAGFLVTMGTLSDRIGRRKLLLIGAALFGVASIIAAFSNTPEIVIVMRALLGIAGATIVPSTLGLVRVMFRNSRQLGVAVGVLVSCFMTGAILGPLLGGLLLQYFWWGSVFLVGAPIMALLLILGPLFLPEYRDVASKVKLDFISIILSLAAILPIIYGLKELVQNGWQVLPILAIVASPIFGVAFVRRQKRLANPLLDLSLFKKRAFSAALSIGLLSGLVMGGVFLFATTYLQLVVGLSALNAGLWLIPQAIAMISVSLLIPHLTHRIRPAYVIAVALLVATIGLLLLTQVKAMGGLEVLVIGLVILALGIAPPTVLSTSLILSSAPPEKAGAAGSLSETSGQLGLALGIALLGSLGTFVYRAFVTHALPATIPTAVSAAARDTLTNALATTSDLPVRLKDAVILTAREAFTDGLHAVAFAGALLLLSLAVIVMLTLRQVNPGNATNEDAIEPL